MGKRDSSTSKLEIALAWSRRVLAGPFQGGSLYIVTHDDHVDLVHEWNFRGRTQKSNCGRVSGIYADQGAKILAEVMIRLDEETRKIPTVKLSIKRRANDA